MSWVYTQADYHGIVDDDYRRYTYFDVRRQFMGQRWNAFRNNKILIAGCGYGYLVNDLMADGFNDVWGCDASAWGIQQAKALHPHIANRFVQADVTVRQNLNNLRSVAGLSGNQRFRATLTEDLLPCAMSATEAQTMLTELRRLTTDMAHIITTRFTDPIYTKLPDGSIAFPDGTVVQMPGFLWLTVDEWRGVVGPGEPIIPTSTYEYVL